MGSQIRLYKKGYIVQYATVFSKIPGMLHAYELFEEHNLSRRDKTGSYHQGVVTVLSDTVL